MLEHALSRVEVIEVDPLVRPVRGLLDVARSEQNAWYPRAVDEEAGVARCPPGRDVARNARFGHRRRHRPHQVMVLRYLECQVVGACTTSASSQGRRRPAGAIAVSSST